MKNSNWESKFFGECALLVKDHFKPDKKNSVPYIGLEHIEQDTLRLIDVGDSLSIVSQKLIFKKGDILFGKLRPYFRKVIYSEFNGICSTDIFVVRAKPGTDQQFLYYLMASQEFVDIANSSSTGTRMPRADWDFLCGIKFQIPDLNEQKNITKILSDLDKKIVILNKLNKNLEQIIRTIFKSWFIDFNDQTEFVDSEFDEIPKGWQIVDLFSQINIKHGYAFKGEYFQDFVTEYILLTPGNFAIGGGYQDDKIKYYNGPVNEKFVLNGGELLVTMTDLSKMGDTLGYPAFVPMDDKKKFLHNQRLGKILIKSHSYISLPYVYCLMCTREYRHEILGSATGTTVKHTSPERIMNLKFTLPPKELVTKFDSLAKPIFHLISSLKREQNSLQIIRDLLLPKLISGEIRV